MKRLLLEARVWRGCPTASSSIPGTGRWDFSRGRDADTPGAGVSDAHNTTHNTQHTDRQIWHTGAPGGRRRTTRHPARPTSGFSPRRSSCVRCVALLPSRLCYLVCCVVLCCVSQGVPEGQAERDPQLCCLHGLEGRNDPRRTRDRKTRIK